MLSCRKTNCIINPEASIYVLLHFFLLVNGQALNMHYLIITDIAKKLLYKIACELIYSL